MVEVQHLTLPRGTARALVDHPDYQALLDQGWELESVFFDSHAEAFRIVVVRGREPAPVERQP